MGEVSLEMRFRIVSVDNSSLLIFLEAGEWLFDCGGLLRVEMTISKPRSKGRSGVMRVMIRVCGVTDGGNE